MAQQQSKRLVYPSTKLSEHLRLMQDAVNELPYMDRKERSEHLRALKNMLLSHQTEIAAAIGRDFGTRARQETQLAEIFGVVSNINSTLRHLKKWMKPQRRSTGLPFQPGKSQVLPQPKGVVGIITPWNYPLFLSCSPLTSAFSAGNRCMLKMAATSENLKQTLAPLFEKYFPADVVRLFPDASAREFSALPFDHILFTGSAQVGKTVMKAAAENLTPVTLELGGKSPTIIDKDFPIELALERILFMKFLNAGQTCIAPDYLFVHESKMSEVVSLAKEIMLSRYENIHNKQYTSIITQTAYERLREYIKEAESKGHPVHGLLNGKHYDERARKIMPLIIETGTDDDLAILNEEIFGPILPVKTYTDLTEVTDYINARQRPLALYFFSFDKKLTKEIILSTLSGGVGVNVCGFHALQHDLPFGGIGHSGIGQYHGYEGFLELSKLRPIFMQPKFSLSKLLYPPYGKIFDNIIKLMYKS